MGKPKFTKEEKEWPSWTDMLGQEYRPGDFVVYATISGRSPVMNYGKVDRINRINSRGETIRGNGRWFVSDTEKDANGRPIRKYVEGDPSCTVTIVPLENGRNFYRWSDRKTTIQIPGNIVKVVGGDAYLNQMEEILKGYVGEDQGTPVLVD